MQKLLLAVDLADSAEHVVDLVAPWAERLGAVVDLLHVTPLIAPVPEVPDAEVQALMIWEMQRAEGIRKDRLNELLRRLPEGRRGEGIAIVGPIAATIVEEAARYDLVAVASHGRTGLQRVWLGSVAERVVRTCPKPVLVLRFASEG
jgi:nucleotide-binding universal stress UspA family protein